MTINKIHAISPLNLDVRLNFTTLIDDIEPLVKEHLTDFNFDRVILLNPLLQLEPPSSLGENFIKGCCQLKDQNKYFSGFYEIKLILCPIKGHRVESFRLLGESFSPIDQEF